MNNRLILELLETTDQLIDCIEENYSGDLKVAKKFAVELKEELEELLESHDEE